MSWIPNEGSAELWLERANLAGSHLEVAIYGLLIAYSLISYAEGLSQVYTLHCSAYQHGHFGLTSYDYPRLMEYSSDTSASFSH